MSPHKHESVQDNYEKFLQRRAAVAQDSYERYLQKKKNQPVKEDTQPIYHRRLSAEQQRKKRTLYIVLIAAVAVVIFSVALLIRGIAENREYSRYMSAAQASTLNGDYENALSQLRKAASINMSDECLLIMAQCYEALGNYDRAIEALRYMESSDSAINSKIASIEAKKKSQEEEHLVTVAGTAHSVTETSLVLDNLRLGNDVLEEVAGLYALNNLSLAGNNITDISALSVLGGLTTLNLNNNAVRSLAPLSLLTSLRTLYLDNNPITDFTPLYSLTSLTTLSVKGINISDSALQALSAALPNCAINGADRKEENQVIALGGTTFNSDVTTLDLSHRGIMDISALSSCDKLTSLNLSGNAISDLTPLMDIPGLQYLYLSGNNISDLRPLMGLSSIKYLDVSGNAISTTVPLGSNTSLLELNLANNPISNFSGIAKLKNLNSLNLSATGFSDQNIDVFSFLTKLVTLNVENNYDLTGEGYRSLKNLIPYCSIAHSDLVYSVTADKYTIASDTRELNLENMGISDLSFLMQLKYLEKVQLSGNSISNIYYFQYTESWRSITWLDLSNNQITDIYGLTNLRNLTTLNLSYNMIADITALYSLSNLRELYLTGNPVSDMDIRALNSALPYCYIVY